MFRTTIAIILTSLFWNEAKSQCVYNATVSQIGLLECDNGPAENITGMFIREGNIPEIKVGLLQPFKNVRYIYVSRVNVHKIEPGAFDGLDLQILHFYVNQIKKISPGTLNSLNNTTSFEMTFNQLEALEANTFLGMESLSWMSLSANHIKRVDRDAFKGLKKLQTLFLASNKIDSLALGTFDDCVSLQLIGLNHNLLKQIHFGLFSQQQSLEKLALEHNYFERFPDYLFYNLTRLKSVDLSQNKISKLQENLFYGIENLERLAIYRNNLETLDVNRIFSHLPSLQEVEMYDNPWMCEELRKMRTHFEEKGVVSPIPVPVYNKPNIDGIGCVE